MNACVIGFVVHSILALPMSIPTSFIDSFKSCVTSDSVVSLWNPVTTDLPSFMINMLSLWFLPSSIFVLFIHVKDFFYVRDSFIELLVPVIFIFFHIHDG